MKRLFVLIFFVLLGLSKTYAQDADFIAVTAGYLNTNNRVTTLDVSENNGNSGFYAGVITERYVSYEFWIQAELLYANVDDISFIKLPVMAKFYLSDNFSLIAGPQIAYRLEKNVQNFTNLNFSLGLGFGYNISQKLIAFARYNHQLNDYFTGDSDFSSKDRNFNIGLAYKFKSF